MDRSHPAGDRVRGKEVRQQRAGARRSRRHVRAGQALQLHALRLGPSKGDLLYMPSCAVMRVRVQPVRCGADGVIHEQGQALGQYADMLIALRTSQSKYLAFVPTEGKLVIGLSTFFAHHTTFIVVNTHRNTHTFQTPLSASTACSWWNPDRRVPRATLCTCGTPPAGIWL